MIEIKLRLLSGLQGVNQAATLWGVNAQANRDLMERNLDTIRQADQEIPGFRDAIELHTRHYGGMGRIRALAEIVQRAPGSSLADEARQQESEMQNPRIRFERIQGQATLFLAGDDLAQSLDQKVNACGVQMKVAGQDAGAIQAKITEAVSSGYGVASRVLCVDKVVQNPPITPTEWQREVDKANKVRSVLQKISKFL